MAWRAAATATAAHSAASGRRWARTERRSRRSGDGETGHRPRLGSSGPAASAVVHRLPTPGRAQAALVESVVFAAGAGVLVDFSEDDVSDDVEDESAVAGVFGEVAPVADFPSVRLSLR